MQGHHNSELTALGRAQAEAVAPRVADLAPSTCYVSDLTRAIQTARPIAEACRLEPIVDVRLRERDLGVFDGLTREENHERFPDEWARYLSGDPDFVVSGGESARQRHDRTLAALGDYVTRHEGEVVAVVAHGGTLESAFRMAMGIPLAAPRPCALLNATLNVIDCTPAGWVMVTWGDTAHLHGLAKG